MKNHCSVCILGLIILIFSSGTGLAQKGFTLGFKAIPHTTMMLNADDSDAPKDVFTYKRTWGMAGGPSFGYNFHDKFGVSADFLYSTQGQKSTYINSREEEVTQNTRLQYIKMPILFTFSTYNEFDKIMFSAGLGFQGSILTHARYYNDDQSYVPDVALFDNVSDYPNTYSQYNVLDYGPVVEAGINMKLKYNVMANLRLRADYSLADAENKDANYRITNAGSTNIVDIYNSERAKTTNVTAGLLIGITYIFAAY